VSDLWEVANGIFREKIIALNAYLAKEQKLINSPSKHSNQELTQITPRKY
jgi:hypothetical protein